MNVVGWSIELTGERQAGRSCSPTTNDMCFKFAKELEGLLPHMRCVAQATAIIPFLTRLCC